MPLRGAACPSFLAPPVGAWLHPPMLKVVPLRYGTVFNKAFGDHEGCDDLATLDRWMLRVHGAKRAVDVFG